MKFDKLFFLIILLSVSCASALPVFNFQKQEYLPQETVIGTIEGTDLEINPSYFKIYEGRREVLFEKNIIFFEGKNYLYIIPTKQGTFSLEINNVLFNDSGNLNSLDLKKNITILENGNSTSRLTIRPGVYIGYLPEIYLLNSGSEPINISYLMGEYNLLPGKSNKLDATYKYGLNLLEINSYSNFKVPIIYLKENQTNINQTENNSQFKENRIELKNLTALTLIKGEKGKSSISVSNLGQINLTELKIKSELKNLNIQDEVSLEINETKEISFQINTSQIGFYSGNISFYYNEEILASTKLEIYVFENVTKLTNFEQNKNSTTALTCSQLGGDLCEENEDCVGNYDFAGGICCLETKCVARNDNKKSSLDYIIGIIIFLLVCGGIYFFYNRNKKLTIPNAEYNYKIIEENYKKKTIGK